MLTITYSIIVLSKEQQNARRIVAALERSLYSGQWNDRRDINLAWLERVFNRLMHVNRFCHERKVELYLEPVVHNISCGDHAMFDRLDSLNASSSRILRHACQQAQRILEGSETGADTLVSAIELYCAQLQERFSLEESELLPAAYRLLTQEEWFRIAAHCLLGPGKGKGKGGKDRKGRQTCFYGISGTGQRERLRYAQ
ncbi:MAG TPA: hypothetical protein VJ698_13010 [Noviherbaspirillum sp.]|uniref:hypothetical protein n=1 Tax=Noviherbaspirillum sp. TaxID=1926288 RepID=UPI002B4A3804|nr:hypothetical protein [Noviherbaspirillum sp.]HJV86387.1 hypothetical protein [Noviherbaspirillum sp.]